MPNFRLLADFDRDGHVRGSDEEHRARMQAPGAILVANLDADWRGRLPDRVADYRPTQLDQERYGFGTSALNYHDDELMPVSVEADATLPEAIELRLRLEGSRTSAARIRIYDRHGRLLRSDPHRPSDRILPLAEGASRADLFVEARTIPGAPFARAMRSRTPGGREPQEQAHFCIAIVEPRPPGRELVHDRGMFTVAPLLFLHSGLRATRVYVQALPDRNPVSGQPHVQANFSTIDDLEKAIDDLPGVDLIKVPPSGRRTVREYLVSQDTWLQDQFAFGAMVGTDGIRQTVLHLPRMRTDSQLNATSNNLARLVRAHFPSSNCGVLDDFWLRVLSFSDADGKVHRIGIAEAAAIGVLMIRVRNHVRRYRHTIRHFRKQAGMEQSPRPRDRWSWSRGRLALDRLHRELVQVLELIRRRDGTTPQYRKYLEELEGKLRRETKLAGTLFPWRNGRLAIRRQHENRMAWVSTDRADDLYRRLLPLSSSFNFGGNLLAAPPTPAAVLGKLVVGSADASDDAYGQTAASDANSIRGQQAPNGAEEERMDPDLAYFLENQPQPRVDLDTRWLQVGHVDEILSFVPDRRSRDAQDFAVLRASSKLAMRILEAARSRYQAGLPGTTSGRRRARVLTDQGTSPITRMLRGKLWRHAVIPASSDGGWPINLDPPDAYVRLAEEYAASPGPRSSDIVFDWELAPGASDHHPADISIEEWLYVERDDDRQSTNMEIERRHLVPSFRALRREFPNQAIFSIPVLFDRIGDFDTRYHTSAFLPNVVNLQVVGDQLLVPRPYGPRMRVDDALAVMWDVLNPQSRTGSRVFDREHARIEDEQNRSGQRSPIEQDIPTDEDLVGHIRVSALIRNLDPELLRRFGLDRPQVWVSALMPGRVDSNHRRRALTLSDIANQFRDVDAELPRSTIEQRIHAANPRMFDRQGQLTRAWLPHLMAKLELPERTVDLFELYVFLVARSLGLNVRWIDSWYYHLNGGEIHCGTQVMREPDTDWVRRARSSWGSESHAGASERRTRAAHS